MHARTFLCREALWQTFEEIAREQGAPIDDLLADAMRAYARQRAYSTGEEAHAGEVEDLARTNVRPPAQRMTAPTGETHGAVDRMGRPLGPPAHGRSSSGLPAPPPRGPGSTGGMPATRAPMQRPFTAPITQPLSPPLRGGLRGPPPPPAPYAPAPSTTRGTASASRSMPPPLPMSEPAPTPYAARGRAVATLSVLYQGRSVDVLKERFIIGRSKSQADLVLDDPNVSRQHAAIERVGEAWFLADLGSTNGCYVDGERVSRRQLVNGDVIEITTHHVLCAMR